MTPRRPAWQAAALDSMRLGGLLTAVLLLGPTSAGLVGRALLLSVVALGWLAAAIGLALVPHLGVRRSDALHAPATLVAGYTALSLVHLAITVGGRASAIEAFPFDLAGLGAIGWLALRLRPRDDSSRGAADSGAVAASGAWRDVAIVVGCAALVGLWTRGAVDAVANARATGVFPAWQDFLLHAAEISYVRDYPAYAGFSQYLSDLPQPLYHRASYALPALVSALSGTPSLELATAFWLPAGLIVCTLGIYALGAALAGSLGGAAAVIAVWMVPDASTYGFENAFLSVHWLLQIAPGAGYAIGIVLVAMATLVRGGAAHGPRERAVLIVAIATSAAFRIHVAMIAAGMLAILVAVAAARRPRARDILLAVATILLAGGVAVWMESLQLAPHFLTQTAHPVRFFESVHQQSGRARALYGAWTSGTPDAWRVMLGSVLLLVSEYGVWLPLVVAASVSRSVWGVSRSLVTTLVAGLLVSRLAVILLVPTAAHGDVTELGHRGFVFVYVALAALTGAATARVLDRRSRQLAQSTRAAWAIALLGGLAGITVPWRSGPEIQQRWAPELARLAMPAGLIDAARFVRAHAAPEDVVLAASEDPVAVTVALSERRALLSRSLLYRMLGPATTDLLERHHREHALINRPESIDMLRAFGRRTGVTWYVADTAAADAWPERVRASCAFCGPVRVYRLR